VRTTLLLLLVALALTSTVSYAQDGNQKPSTEVDVVVEPPPPHPEPEPPPGPPAITLPPAEPGEELHIAKVTIGSAEQLAVLQRLGFSCAEGAVCEIAATEAQLSALREAGFALDVFGLVGESHLSGEVDPWQENGLEELSRFGENLYDHDIPDHGSATSTINISGAPAGARVTRLKYACRIEATGLTGGPSQYTLQIRAASLSSGITIWNREGGDTDQGRDDDISDDRDIHLEYRWVDAFFDGQPVNQAWGLRASDHTTNILGGGNIDWWQLWVYYCTAAPGAPTLKAPANAGHICDTTPSFDWSDVAEAKSYQMQVDDDSGFGSPAIDTTRAASNYTATIPLARRQWFWRVRSHNECGWGSWSGTKSFWIDSRAAVPAVVAPTDGSHTCDSTPYFDWADAAGATGYRIQVDDNPDFSSPMSQFTRVSNFTPAAPLPPDRHYWRVRGESACGNGDWTSVRSFTVDAEPATPSGPLPASGTTGVSVNADLNWADSAGASAYDVYFGTAASPPMVGTVSVSQYNLPTLTADTLYYWKIVAKNAGCRTVGPVWRFRTVALGPNHPPTNGSLTPNSGGAPAGRIVYFTSNYHDPDGEADLKACRLHIGRWDAPKSLIGNAVVLYQARTNKLLLRNDRGTRWWGGKLVGSANVIQNSQVKVYCDRTTVTRGGTRIEVRWALEFKPAFRGRTKVYLKARDLGGLTSPLEQKGTWTVQ
jgi:hypothetical protein